MQRGPEHPGAAAIVHRELGAEELAREVNDRAFDVSLHVHFESRAAHDVYQEHPRHKRFIQEMNANWQAVRVFDSWVEG